MCWLKLKFKRQNHYFFRGGWVGGVEKSRIKLTSAKVKVEVKAELGNISDHHLAMSY